MLSYLDTINALQTRTIAFSPQEYMFVLQCVLGERIEVAYANTFDASEFNRNVPSEYEEEYLSRFKHDAENLLSTQECIHLKDELTELYRSDVQASASTLEDYKFSGEEVQKLLANLLHDRSENLSESSVRDILSLIKTMYEQGALDSGDSFQRHFITIPTKFNALCTSCNKEMSVVEGLDMKCPNCGATYHWDESTNRFYPKPSKL